LILNEFSVIIFEFEFEWVLCNYIWIWIWMTISMTISMTICNRIKICWLTFYYTINESLKQITIILSKRFYFDSIYINQSTVSQLRLEKICISLFYYKSNWFISISLLAILQKLNYINLKLTAIFLLNFLNEFKLNLNEKNINSLICLNMFF
jgi:hypothetical protein